MNNSSKKSGASPHFPTREAVLEFVSENGGNVSKRDIARAFNIKGNDKIALKRLLRDMADDGDIARRSKNITEPGALPRVTVLEVTGRDSDGHFTATPANWEAGSQGAAPLVTLSQRQKASKRGPREPAVGVGDRILARLSLETRKTGKNAATYSARVIRRIGKAANTILGIFRNLPDGGGFIEPVEKSALRELNVEPHETGQAKSGDLVSVEPIKSGRYGPSRGKVVERHGPADSEKAVSRIAIVQFGIPDTFPQSVVDETNNAKPVKLGTREDWRELPLLTIDPPDARDHDDAVYAEPDADKDNPNGWIVYVAIADVAAYVTPSSAMDREALKRGNSVYFPDLVVPMLPERISNDLCSLRESEERPAMAVRMVFDTNGAKKSHTFHRVMMRSSAKLSYEQAQGAIDGKAGVVAPEINDEILKPLWQAYACLKKGRDKREPLDLDLPERKIQLDESGSIAGISIPDRLDAHKLIEEFMIQANVCAAETLEQKNSPLLYRVHDTPSHAKIETLGEFLKSINIKGPKAGNLRPAHFNQILDQVRDTELEELTSQVVLRSQAQAEYLATNYGHFGLNLRRYAHFTSPIRRYADLIVHRALISAFKLGDDGLSAGDIHHLDETAQAISDAERRAMKAERATIDRLVAHYIADQVGATFNGRVSGVTRAGLFVELDETGADGFVPASTLERDYFRLDERRHALIGDATGETFQLGDRIEVRLVEARPVAGALRFDVIGEGSYSPDHKPSKRSGPAKRKKDKPRKPGRKREKPGRK